MTAEQLASKIGATLVGDGAAIIHRCATIETAGEGELTFLANRRYLPYLETTRAAAVVIDPRSECPDRLTRLIASDPYFAFRNAMIELHGFREHPAPMMQASGKPANAISDLATVHPMARIGEGTRLHPRVVVEHDAQLGRNSVLYPGVYVGPHAVIGDDCILHPNVVIYDRCIIGNRVTLHACSVVGSDGFGYATHKGAHYKIPQTGIVVIEDDVELGAGCAIERAAMGETRIGKGSKFADLISIGHGTTIGEHCLLVSLVGVSGSVEVGNHVVLGGQVGVAGHLRIGNRVQAAARTAIVQDVPDDQKIGGVPALPIDLAKRNALAGLELYELFKRVKKLERSLGRQATGPITEDDNERAPHSP